MEPIVDNKKFYLNFEFYCIEKHKKTFNQEVYHWFNIPDYVLIDSNFFSSYEELRNKRKNNYRLREYGLDAISIEIKDNSKIYHGLQMKLWNNTLCANKLGTFLSVIYNRFDESSKGYLYHTSNLEKTLQKDICIKNKIISVKVDNPYQNIFLPEDLLQNSNENIYNKEIKNNITLRKYQIEAISKLNQEWTGIKSLNVPCGCGKTIIFSEHLKDFCYKNIFIFSPLRFLTEQNLERIKSYLPNYNHLLIDTDGIRDINNIISNLDKNTVYSCTFRSASDIISELFNLNENFDINNTILIVDEAHNLLNNNKLISLCKLFLKVLLVTATPSVQLESIIGSTVIYNYSFKEAIEDKYICDYQIYFPYIEKNKDLNNIPSELLHLDNNLANKCLFFINGLLLTGSRRAIVYLKNKEECKIYEFIFNEIMNKYHYFKVLINTITCDVKKDERINIINEFQKNEEEEIIKILLSIRILDEGIDIPKCDSIFISYIGDPNNDIRNIQRICRANRIDNTNNNKVSSVFIWCDNINKSLNTLKLFRDNDIYFHKKIRIKYNIYESKNEIIENKVIKSNHKLSEYINIHCLNEDELFEIRKEQLFRFCNSNNRCIKKNESFEEYKLGKWYYEQKLKIKNNDKNIYDKLSENKYVRNDINNIIKIKFKKKCNSNYECIKCNFTTNRLQIIRKHLNKKNKCDKINLECLNYTDEEIYELSTIRVYKRNDLKCEFCKKTYANKNSLLNHQTNFCKKKAENNPIYNIKNTTSNNSSINNSFNTNIYDNSSNIININIPISFDKDWSMEHIDNCIKVFILNAESKYTKFLENILNNKINLNVIIDKDKNDAIVFSGDKYENMEKNELFSKSMEKINDQLSKLKEDIHKDLEYKEFINDSDKNIEIVNKKYKDYLENDSLKSKVNDYLSDIYESRKKDAIKIYQEYNKNKEEKEGF
jgi:hypothetical protein